MNATEQVLDGANAMIARLQAELDAALAKCHTLTVELNGQTSALSECMASRQKLLSEADKNRADLAASQNNLANAEQECADLKAKLEKVEADAAVMRELLIVIRQQVFPGLGLPSKYTVWMAQALATGSGQRLLDELANATEDRNILEQHLLKVCEVAGHNPASRHSVHETVATLRATAQHRLELIKAIEWVLPNDHDQPNGCPVCLEYHTTGHRPDCPLAAELKATP